MTKKAKTWIIIGSIVGGLALTFGAVVIYFNSPLSRFGIKGGELIKINAKKIGKTAFQKEKKVKIKDHEFTYYNVKSDSEGNWILVDNTSYIINKDIVFGFRFKNNGGLVKITSYENSMEPRSMGEFYENPSYTSYSVHAGFKIMVDESVDISEYPDGFNLGIFEHWC